MKTKTPERLLASAGALMVAALFVAPTEPAAAQTLVGTPSMQPVLPGLES